MENSNEQTQKTVNFLAYKIKNFDEEKLKTDEGNEEYNRLIVKKAVLAQKLKSVKKSFFRSFIDKIMRKTKGKTLICDRF